MERSGWVGFPQMKRMYFMLSKSVRLNTQFWIIIWRHEENMATTIIRACLCHGNACWRLYQQHIYLAGSMAKATVPEEEDRVFPTTRKRLQIKSEAPQLSYYCSATPKYLLAAVCLAEMAAEPAKVQQTDQSREGKAIISSSWKLIRAYSSPLRRMQGRCARSFVSIAVWG